MGGRAGGVCFFPLRSRSENTSAPSVPGNPETCIQTPGPELGLSCRTLMERLSHSEQRGAGARCGNGGCGAGSTWGAPSARAGVGRPRPRGWVVRIEEGLSLATHFSNLPNQLLFHVPRRLLPCPAVPWRLSQCLADIASGTTVSRSLFHL